MFPGFKEVGKGSSTIHEFQTRRGPDSIRKPAKWAPKRREPLFCGNLRLTKGSVRVQESGFGGFSEVLSRGIVI